MVNMSQMEIPIRMVLVGEAILGLERTMMMRMLLMMVIGMTIGMMYPYTGLTNCRGPKNEVALTT